MSRPARNRLLFAAFWVGCLVLGNLLPADARLPMVGAMAALTLCSFIVARRFFIGRSQLRRRQWIDAIASFQAFEHELTASPWKRRMSWLAAGLYTRDPIAIARNNIGVVHLENDKLDLADATFRSALERDRDYAVPVLNLAVVAAKRGDQGRMESQLADAARLGLSGKKLHARVRAALKAR